MRRYFSESKKHLATLITLLVLAGCGAGYYLVYIPNNEKTLYEQHFRWLQNIDKNIRNKIDAYNSLLASTLTAYSLQADRDTKDSSVWKYFSSRNVPISSFSVDTNRSHIDSASNSIRFFWNIGMSNKSLIIQAKKKIENKALVEIGLTYNFEDFIKPLLPAKIFEHYVIFYRGKYIYEDFRSGLGYNPSEEDSLIKISKFITGATIIDQDVAGVNYKIFLQPINFFQNDTLNDRFKDSLNDRLIIAALHSQEKLNAEKKALPPHTAVWIITIALGILLFLPWSKLYLLGKNDKLSLSDVTESVLVAKLLMAFLVLLFFKNNSSFRPHCSFCSKEVLADTIQSAFKREVSNAYTCMHRLDSFFAKNKPYRDIVHLMPKDSSTPKFDTTGDVVNPTYKPVDISFKENVDILDSSLNRKQFIEVSWMDDSGNLKHNWTKYGINTFHANYSDRDYFKNIKNNITIRPNGNSDISSLTLDQILSRSDGTFRSIICSRSVAANGTDVKYVALTFRMKTLDSVIMPAGFSFAIIDDTGAVRYHSEQDRNLNESLLYEFSEKKELQDALQGRFTEVFKTKYYDNEYIVRVEPIKNYPYFIVIMSDQSFPDSVDIETFSFTWGMILLFMIIVITDLFILIRASSKTSLFKKQFLVLSWLWPRATSDQEYLFGGTGNIIMIISLIAGLNLFRPLQYFFVLVFCIPLVTIFLNSIFVHKYKTEKNDTYIRYKVRSAWWSACYLVLLNILAFEVLGWSSYWPVFLFEIGIIVIGRGILIYYYDHVHRKYLQIGNQPNPYYLYYYTFMILTRLLITSGIPVIFVFTASYSFEKTLLVRYRQYDFILQLEKKFKSLANIQEGTLADYRNAIYTDNTWLGKIDATRGSVRAIDTNELSREDSNTARMFNLFGSYLENISGISNDNFYKSSSSDGRYLYNNFFRNISCDTGKSKLYAVSELPVSTGDNARQKPGSLRYLLLTSPKISYLFPRIFTSVNGTEFWLLFLTAIALFYYILYQVIKKVFPLSAKPILPWKDVDTISQNLSLHRPLVWVVGLTADDMLEKVKSDLNIPSGEKDYVLDFDNLSATADKNSKDTGIPQMEYHISIFHIALNRHKDSSWDKMKSALLKNRCEYAILLHIEHRLDDPETTRKKFELIKELWNKNKKVIIISAMHPFYIDEIVGRHNELKYGLVDEETSMVINTLFSDSPVIVMPLIIGQQSSVVNATVQGQLKNNNTAIIAQVVNAEMKYTRFLNSLKNEFIKQSIQAQTGTKKIQTDTLILQIQSFAHNFYYSLWQSLSPDEKFILYDLAEDGLVNIKNSFAVNLLINKGIITTEEGYLHIFNRSFRNFIVTSIGDQETKYLQGMHAKGSTWSKMQAPLVLIVLAVLVFLSISQVGAYTQVITVLSSIGAAIPILLRLLSMFGSQNSGTEKSSLPKPE